MKSYQSTPPRLTHRHIAFARGRWFASRAATRRRRRNTMSGTLQAVPRGRRLAPDDLGGRTVSAARLLLEQLDPGQAPGLKAEPQEPSSFFGAGPHLNEREVGGARCRAGRGGESSHAGALDCLPDVGAEHAVAMLLDHRLRRSIPLVDIIDFRLPVTRNAPFFPILSVAHSCATKVVAVFPSMWSAFQVWLTPMFPCRRRCPCCPRTPTATRAVLATTPLRNPSSPLRSAGRSR